MLGELEQQFRKLARAAAAIPDANGESKGGVEKDLYIELRELNRKIVLMR